MSTPSSLSLALSWGLVLILSPATILIAQVPSEVASTDQQPAIQDLTRLIKGLKRTEDILESVSVSTRFKVRHETDPATVPFRIETVLSESVFTREFSLDVSTGRGYTRVTGESSNKRPDGTEFREDFEFESAYDGKHGRTVRTSKRANGYVDRHAQIDARFSSMEISPLDFTVHHQGQEVSKILEKQGGKWIGQQTWDGRSVHVVETVPVTRDAEYKTEFCVDPERNYTVVRRRNLMRRLGQDEWTAIYEVDSTKHSEVAPGIWLPGQVRVQRHGRMTTGVNSNWVVNEPIPGSRFHLEFPEGVRVQGLRELLLADVKKSTNYFVAPVTTDLQKHMLRSSEIVAYAALDATALMDLHTEKIHTDRFDFAGFRQASRTIRGQVETGTLRIRVDYGNLLPQGFAHRFVEHALTDLGREAGFEEVQVYERHHGAQYTWRGLDATDEVVGPEQAQGDATVQIYPVRTPLSRHLLGNVDCLVELTGPNSLDSPLLTADQKILIRTADARFDLPKKACVSLIAVMERPNDVERKDLHDLPQVKQGAEFHRPAVALLKDLGFREVRILLRFGGTSIQSTYR